MNLFLLFIFLMNAVFLSPELIRSDDKISVSKIWDSDEYGAFTDLIRFNNSFYCSFRIGKKHVGYEDYGKIRIIKSDDGIQWKSVALIEKRNIDLRDPKLSITPEGEIMVTMAGAFFDENSSMKELFPMVSFSDRGASNFSSPEKVKLDPKINPSKDWIWRVTWDENVGYGIDYQLKEDSKDRSKLAEDAWLLFLVKTKDGKSFDKVSQLEVPHLPNESTIRFDKHKNMYVLIRRESGDKNGILAKSSFPYTSWNFFNLDFRLGGPNFLFLDDEKLAIGTRKYGETRTTVIRVTDLKGKILKEFELPSGGDTSYPGMVIYDSKLWVSYYSSHEGKSSIYLAKIPMNELI